MKICARDVFIQQKDLTSLLRGVFASAGFGDVDVNPKHNGISAFECEIRMPEKFDQAAFPRLLANALKTAKASSSIDQHAEVLTHDRLPETISINSPRQLADWQIVVPS